MDRFKHLMTQMERVANDTIVIFDEQGQPSMTFSHKLDESVANAAKLALKNGVQAFRRHTCERILSVHKDEVCANACPKCGLLPATPKAKVCIWCSH